MKKLTSQDFALMVFVWMLILSFADKDKIIPDDQSSVVQTLVKNISAPDTVQEKTKSPLSTTLDLETAKKGFGDHPVSLSVQ